MGNCELQCKWSMGWLSGEEIVRERKKIKSVYRTLGNEYDDF